MEPNDSQSAVPANTPETPQAPVGPTVTTQETSTTPVIGTPTPVGKSPKKLLGKIGLVPAVAIAALVLIGGSAAAYFGLVLPNQPENVWKTALNNTAKGYDKFITYGEEQKDTKGGTVKGTFKVESPQVVVDGNVDGKFDQKNSNINLDAGAAGTRLKFNILTNIPEGATSPDIYLKAEGLDGLANLLGAGDPATSQMLAGLNNQYYFIDHTLLDQFQKQAAGADASGVSEIKTEDVVDFMKQLGEVNKEYVFTTDANKAIFTVKEEVGKETVEGRETYHFKVALHKEHLKAWNKAVCDKLVDHKIMKALSGGTSDEDRKKECEDTSDFDSIDENQTADVWVDMKTKLIRTVRITPKDSKSTIDFGLLYDGGDEYPFYITVKDEEQGNMTFKVILNTKTDSVTLNADGDFKAADGDSKLTVNVVFQPGNDTVEFTKPEGAKSLSDLIAPFLGGLSAPTGLDQSFSEEDFTDFNLE